MVNPPPSSTLVIPLLTVNPKEIISMFIPVEQRPETSSLHVPPVAAAIPATEVMARHPEPSVEPPEVMEELLIEEVSIDGMCGVY